MRSRRFVLLAGVLVTLNLVLWLAPPGLALRKAIVQQLFGPKMVRAQVLERNGIEYNLDRGVITQVNGSQLTLREADGRIQPIALSASTHVFYFGRSLPLSSLARRWRVVVTWPANGAAQSVDVQHGALRKAVVQALFGPRMVRAQVLEKNGSQWNIDRGVIASVTGSQLVLREADGRIQQIALSASTRVIYFGRSLPLSSLAKRWRVVVTWPANGAALSVDVEHAPKGRGGLGPSAAPTPHLS